MMCIYFFFFKQKTAYEMRISDWSSDVCSSDLFRRHDRNGWPPPPHWAPARSRRQGPPNDFHAIYRRHQEMRSNPRLLAEYPDCGRHSRRGAEISYRTGGYRSDEHTSELQSLMRSSSDVCCMKNKKKNYTL